MYFLKNPYAKVLNSITKESETKNVVADHNKVYIY